MIVKVAKLKPDIDLPQYMTPGSVGFDLRAGVDAEINIGETKKIETGLRFEIPENFEMQIRPRSGISRLGVQAFLGTIDTDYRGDVSILLYNGGSSVFTVCKGDRIAQGIISPIVRAHFVLVDELSVTARGTGGFGHTGIK